MTKTILLVGGGSGGHIIPLLPLYERLLAQGYNVPILTTDSTLDRDIIRDNAPQATHYTLKTDKIRSYRSIQNIFAPFKILWAIWLSYRLLQRVRPDIIFLKGGFLCFPVVLAARYMPSKYHRPRLVLHESDVHSGPLTAFLSARVDCMFRAFDSHNPVPILSEVHTSPPVVLDTNKRPVLLVAGGSQGAEFLNTLVVDALPVLQKYYYTVLITGPGKQIKEWDSAVGEQHESPPKAILQRYITRADVLLIRSGAGLLFETIMNRKPSLTVPHPYGRGYHQFYNASFFAQQHLCRMIEQKDLSVDNILTELQATQTDQRMLQALKSHSITNGTDTIIKRIVEFL